MAEGLTILGAVAIVEQVNKYRVQLDISSL